MNEETVIDELVRDITRAGSMPKSEVRERIQSLLSLHDKKLVEKIRNMEFYENEKTGKIVRKVLDLAAQVIEGQSTNSEYKQLSQ
jgi:hypothetical protein